MLPHTVHSLSARSHKTVLKSPRVSTGFIIQVLLHMETGGRQWYMSREGMLVVPQREDSRGKTDKQRPPTFIQDILQILHVRD